MRDRVVMYHCYVRPWFADTRNSRSRVPLLPSARPFLPRRLVKRRLSQAEAVTEGEAAVVATAEAATEAVPGTDADADADAAGVKRKAVELDGKSDVDGDVDGDVRDVDVAVDIAVDGDGECQGDHDVDVDVVGERWVLFEMQIELGEGKSGVLRVHEGDDPCEVALSFLSSHGLPTDAQVAAPLADTIRQQMQLATAGAAAAAAVV